MTDHALALLEHRLPPGWHITELTPSTVWSSRDPQGNFKPGVGGYIATLSGWCVTVQPDGWEAERGRWFQSGESIREAALRLARSIERVRRKPHLVHLGLDGPGVVTWQGYFLRGCRECEKEAADLFDNDVEWGRGQA